MKWLALAITLIGCKSDPAPPPPPPVRGPHLVFVTAGEGSVEDVVRAETDRADGKRVVVYVGATWCEPCRRFHDAAVAGSLDKSLPPVRFVEFDLDKDEERLKRAGYASKFIPLFAVPGGDGRPTGKHIEGSIKGEGAAAEITPRLLDLLR